MIKNKRQIIKPCDSRVFGRLIYGWLELPQINIESTYTDPIDYTTDYQGKKSTSENNIWYTLVLSGSVLNRLILIGISRSTLSKS